jgi:excisionase family DNA binding protein
VLFTPRETAERLGCSENHVYRLIARGALRAVDIGQPGAQRSKTRVRSDDLFGYIEKQTRLPSFGLRFGLRFQLCFQHAARYAWAWL